MHFNTILTILGQTKVWARKWLKSCQKLRTAHLMKNKIRVQTNTWKGELHGQTGNRVNIWISKRTNAFLKVRNHWSRRMKNCKSHRPRLCNGRTSNLRLKFNPTRELFYQGLIRQLWSRPPSTLKTTVQFQLSRLSPYSIRQLK